VIFAYPHLHICKFSHLHIGIKLHLVKGGIKSVPAEQFFMAANLTDLPFVEDHNQIGFPNGGKAVCDDDIGAATDELINGRLYQLFGFGIHRRGGLIQDQDRGVK